MASTSPANPSIVLEGQLREMYGRAAYTHKTHQKMADGYVTKYKRIKLIEIVLSAATTTSLLVILGQEIDLNIVAALLTIIGYSLNDTIVIYDRIRETLRRENPDSPRPLPEIIQEALGDTMSRTLLTAGTTLVAALALFLLGGPVIYGFALTMLIGVFMGTISSLFVAAPMLPLFGDTLSFKTAVTLGVFERPGEHGVV